MKRSLVTLTSALFSLLLVSGCGNGSMIPTETSTMPTVTDNPTVTDIWQQTFPGNDYEQVKTMPIPEVMTGFADNIQASPTDTIEAITYLARDKGQEESVNLVEIQDSMRVNIDSKVINIDSSDESILEQLYYSQIVRDFTENTQWSSTAEQYISLLSKVYQGEADTDEQINDLYDSIQTQLSNTGG